MKKATSYPTPAAFRQALEARLANIAKAEAVDIQRLRRQVAFDRLLCRIFQASDSSWALKGGYAMELRLNMTRTTKDLDLSWRGQPKPATRAETGAILRDTLQEAAGVDLGDRFTFLIGEPDTDVIAAPYGGARYPVEARMAGRVFARFHVDVGVGDAVLNPLEVIMTRDWLDFAGIPTRPFPSISREQQFAEKLHAYTLPRENGPNTRARDLLDMMLLIHMKIEPATTAEAVAATFKRRAKHNMPAELNAPPAEWATLYAELAREWKLTESMDQAFAVVDAFFRQHLRKSQARHPD